MDLADCVRVVHPVPCIFMLAVQCFHHYITIEQQGTEHLAISDTCEQEAIILAFDSAGRPTSEERAGTTVGFNSAPSTINSSGFFMCEGTVTKLRPARRMYFA